MDMDELGFFLYMDAMEKKQKADSSLNPFADNSEDEDEDEE